MEGKVTEKLLEEWENIDRICYNEDNQMPDKTCYDECIQWRNQILHLRVTGKAMQIKNPDDEENNITLDSEKVRTPNYHSRKSSFSQETSDFSKRQLHKRIFRDVINALVEYVNRELFPDKIEDKKYLNNNSLNSDAISRKSFDKSHNRNKDSLEMQDFFYPPNLQRNYKSIEHNFITSKQKTSKKITEDNPKTTSAKLCTPPIGRNKLGTVFNERIIVSPVPYVVSTRESFSTLKTTPIKLSNESLEVLTSRGRNASSIYDTNFWKSDISRMSHIRSTWQNPVRPTVWPKNLRLAPINASRIPTDFNSRSLAPSPSIPQRNRKALSPISRSVTPSSLYVHNKKDEKSVNYENHSARRRERERLASDRSHSGNRSTKNTQGRLT